MKTPTQRLEHALDELRDLATCLVAWSVPHDAREHLDNAQDQVGLALDDLRRADVAVEARASRYDEYAEQRAAGLSEG